MLISDITWCTIQLGDKISSSVNRHAWSAGQRRGGRLSCVSRCLHHAFAQGGQRGRGRQGLAGAGCTRSESMTSLRITERMMVITRLVFAVSICIFFPGRLEYILNGIVSDVSSFFLSHVRLLHYCALPAPSHIYILLQTERGSNLPQ